MTTLLKVTDQGYTFEEKGARTTMVRVSRVLDAFLPVPWTEEARARGSAIHKAAALLDGGFGGSGLHWPSVNPEIVPYLRAWERCKAEVLAGPLKHSLLIDVKSGVAHTRHQLQTALYKVALLESFPPTSVAWIFLGWVERFVWSRRYGYAGTLDRFYPAKNSSQKIIRRACVYLHANGTYQVVWHDDPLDEAAAVGMVQAWHWYQKYLTKKERERR